VSRPAVAGGLDDTAGRSKTKFDIKRRQGRDADRVRGLLRPRSQWASSQPHQGRWCYGKTPTQTFLDSIPLAKEKLLVA
jgi:hypothetical protein